MNVLIAKFLMYHDIQRLHAEGYSLVKIASIVNRRTVSRYLEMTEKEFEAFRTAFPIERSYCFPMSSL